MLVIVEDGSRLNKSSRDRLVMLDNSAFECNPQIGAWQEPAGFFVLS